MRESDVNIVTGWAHEEYKMGWAQTQWCNEKVMYVTGLVMYVSRIVMYVSRVVCVSMVYVYVV